MTSLNKEQIAAVEHVDTPLLVLAGAGSGKTRVLIQKIVYLINNKIVLPDQIVAITFTNKAAKEMNIRLQEALSDPLHPHPYIGTFHAFCLTILRENLSHLGFSTPFVIYDKSKQIHVMKQLLKEAKITDVSPNIYLGKISKLKQRVPNIKQYFEEVGSEDPVFQTIGSKYQLQLEHNNALDFDDILGYVVDLFSENPSVLAHYQEKIQYVLVDEYQDTNPMQYRLLKQLASQHENITVVGDFDQAIYSWRGATIKNILEFEKDFEGANTIRLEQNYRSTKVILEASNALIQHNTERKPKKLWTQNPSGEPIAFSIAFDEREEAQYVVSQIKHVVNSKNKTLNDVAILYRTHAQSRILEEVLNQNQVLYRLVGGTMFYQRQEIKDILAYLQLLENPHDNLSFVRAIQRPLRGIGDTSIKKLLALSETHGKSIATLSQEGLLSLSKSQDGKILSFFNSLARIQRECLDLPKQTIEIAIDRIITESGYHAMLEKKGSPEALARLDTLYELKSIVTDDITSLNQLLHHISLLSDIDQIEDGDERVSLMTLHHAKGLEFPVVFIIGYEEGLLPFCKRNNSDQQIEEERRLAYVGITRGQEHVFLSAAYQRTIFGELWSHDLSRFVKEMPPETYTCRVSHKAYKEGRGVTHVLQKQKISYIVESDGGNSEFKLHLNGDSDLAAGDWVAHKVWGRGIITKIEGSGETAMYHIQFGRERKTLMAKYAPLNKLDE